MTEIFYNNINVFTVTLIQPTRHCCIQLLIPFKEILLAPTF